MGWKPHVIKLWWGKKQLFHKPHFNALFQIKFFGPSKSCCSTSFREKKPQKTAKQTKTLSESCRSIKLLFCTQRNILIKSGFKCLLPWWFVLKHRLFHSSFYTSLCTMKDTLSRGCQVPIWSRLLLGNGAIYDATQAGLI